MLQKTGAFAPRKLKAQTMRAVEPNDDHLHCV
jgi:hypothetical protein